MFPNYVILIKIRFVINKIWYSGINNLVLDIHLFVSAVIQIFVSAQEELSKTDQLFQGYDNTFTKISSLEIEELLEKHILQHLDNVKKGNEKSWRHDMFYKNYAEQSRTQKSEDSKPNDLTFYIDYGGLRREHLDTLTDFINRREKFKGNLDYNLKVLLPGALIKLAQVTLKRNRLEAKFYWNGIVAGTDCDEILSKRLVSNSSASWYLLLKWKKILAVEICKNYSLCKFYNLLVQTFGNRLSNLLR